MKKFILISPAFNNDINKYTLSNFYTKAIVQSGGVPIMTPYENIDNIDQLLDSVDGVILSGGGDIHSKFFNDELHPKASFINILRDEFEIKLCQEIIKRDMPLLCICRGAQVLNVAVGGNLHQHIENHVEDGNNDLEHNIDIIENSYFERLFNKKCFNVNSIHHQAINECPSNVEILAYCDDVIEAIKIKDKKFIVGVQYHPERLYETHPESKILFDEFMKYCNE